MRVQRHHTETPDQDRIIPVPREGRLAVSEQQRYLWFLHQLAPESAAYHEPHALRLRGDLDLAALAEALRGLAARHESLRTRFWHERGVPYQIVDAAPAAVPLPVSEGGEKSVPGWISAAVSAPFDLAHGPLFRCSLLRLGPRDHLLMLVWHQIAADGWSARRIGDELAERYAAARHRTSARLPDLDVQPADHAAWQCRWLQGEQAARHLSHWRDVLDGAELVEFPSDRPRPAQPSGAGAEVRSALPAELCSALRSFAAAEDIPLFPVLVAGFQVVIGRYSGQRDLIFGCLLPGRTQPALESLVGFFANTVALRGSLAGNPGFRALAHRCDQALLDAMAHQDVPFGVLVKTLRPDRVAGRNPLFQHVFSWRSASAVPRFQLDGVQVEEWPARPDTARFDLTVQLTDEADGRISLCIEYATELYDRDRIERMTEHLVTGLSSALAAPDQAVGSLNVLPAGERGRLLGEWNPVPVPRECGVLQELVAARVAQAPDRVAMRFGGGELSYRELDVRSSRLANVLAGAGAGPGQVVGVLLERGFGLPVAELGVLKAGAGWLPLDPQYPPDRVAYQLGDAAVALVVTTRDLAGQLPAGVSPVLLDSGVLDGQPDTPPQVRIGPADVAYVIYTSGSTGKPKGVMVPHRAAANFCAAFGELFAVTPQDRILQFSNPAFDVSVSDFFATFAAGATVVGAPRSVLLDPGALLELMRQEKVTFADIPPAILRLLDPGPLTDLRVLFIGMEPFGPELVNRWARPGREFHNGYGPTEATITCVDYRCPDQVLTAQPPIGRAMANQRAYVLDRQLQLAPVGVPGELYMAGAGLAHGYLGRPDLTADKFRPDPYAPGPGERMYATGDLVRWRADGNLEFLGRIDRQVKIRGLRVEPGEIEQVLAGYPGVSEAAVLVKEAGTPQARLIGYLVPDREHGVDLGQVREYASDRLPLHMIPAALLGLDRLPLTAAGKLDQARLPDAEAGPGTGHVEPGTDSQRRLAGVWRGLLGPEAGQIGATDSFFAIGGNSLQVTQLISRIRDAFGVTIEPRQVFAQPVLEQLASRIDDAVLQESDHALVARLEAEIAELSEAELDRLLAADEPGQAQRQPPEGQR